MSIDIVCIGKLKEKYYKEAQSHYIKLLSRFAKVNVIEVADISLEGVKSEKEERKVKDRECSEALKRAKGYIIACDTAGVKYNSEGFSRFIADKAAQGNISIIIGGSLGLNDEVKNKADSIISFSDMTLPHRLFRIVLLEQLFRAFKIDAGETYHK